MHDDVFFHVDDEVIEFEFTLIALQRLGIELRKRVQVSDGDAVLRLAVDHYLIVLHKAQIDRFSIRPRVRRRHHHR